MNRDIFGEWFVMTKENILEWDVLMDQLEKNGIDYRSPSWGWTTASKKEETEE